MLLLLYIFIVSLLGLLILFGYQMHRLRAGAIDRLPNVTAAEVVAPAVRFVRHWLLIVQSHIRAVTVPILLLFYKALLSLLHTLTSRIAHKFNHLADTIKGKAVKEHGF